MVIKQWDRVQIKTTKRINWVNAPEGVTPTPHGVWTVAGILGDDLLVTKSGCACRVPILDVVLEVNDGKETR